MTNRGHPQSAIFDNLNCFNYIIITLRCQDVENNYCLCFFMYDIIKEFEIIINNFMEQYPIPQFIEAESKIRFLISFRQFFYLVGAGVACFPYIFYFAPYCVLHSSFSNCFCGSNIGIWRQ